MSLKQSKELIKIYNDVINRSQRLKNNDHSI